MKVMVTGAAGYIGSVLCRILNERGHEVYACDINSLDNIKSYCEQVVQFSFDSLVVCDLIRIKKIDTVIHLAATSTVGPDAVNPLLYYENNAGRTINFLDRLRRIGCRPHIIFASTAAVYGAQIFKLAEDSALKPVNHYGQSKLMCEKIIESAAVYDIPSTLFRFFNVVGAYCEFGEEALDTHLLSKLCHAANSSSPLIVFGDDYSTRDGSCVRDYIHVVDVCNAIIKTIGARFVGSKTYNLGTGEGTSVFEMIAAFEKYTNQKPSISIGDRREGDPPVLIANGTAFKQDYNFSYDNSCLYKMITSTWNYYTTNWSENGI